MIKLIAIDMDSTLLRDDKTFEVERFRQAVTALKAQGTQVCIASGNSYVKLRGYFDDRLRNDLIFAGMNGNDIVVADRSIERLTIDVATTQALVEFLDEFEGFYALVGTDKRSYAVTQNAEALDYFARYNPDVSHLTSFASLPQEEAIMQISIMSQRTIAENKTMVRIINERFEAITAVTSGGKWIDVFHHQGGKGYALRYLQAKGGYDARVSMTFGDSLNDRSMMKEAVYSIAMANSDRELLPSCRYQIGSNNQQAVIEVLEQVVKDSTLAFMVNYQLEKEERYGEDI